jgi:hypothetical protein
MPEMVFYSACNCVQDRKIEIPSAFAKYFSTEGGYPHLTLPVDGNENVYLQFHEWKRHGCARWFMHQEVKCFGAVMQSDEGPVQFYLMQNAIEQIGQKRLPNLYRLTCALGVNTSGSIFMHQALAILEEIAVLRQQEIRIPFLIDSYTGAVVRDDVIECAERVPVLLSAGDRSIAPNVFGRITSRGFHIFVQSAEDGTDEQEVFEAQYFEQKIHEPKFAQDEKHRDVVFTNLENGKTFVTDAWITGRDTQNSQIFHVESRKSELDLDFADVIEMVCHWVLDTGQPAHYAGYDALLIEWVPPIEECEDPLADRPKSAAR